jgi:hypothetical protein
MVDDDFQEFHGSDIIIAAKERIGELLMGAL